MDEREVVKRLLALEAKVADLRRLAKNSRKRGTAHAIKIRRLEILFPGNENWAGLTQLHIPPCPEVLHTLKR